MLVNIFTFLLAHIIKILNRSTTPLPPDKLYSTYVTKFGRGKQEQNYGTNILLTLKF